MKNQCSEERTQPGKWTVEEYTWLTLGGETLGGAVRTEVVLLQIDYVQCWAKV